MKKFLTPLAFLLLIVITQCDKKDSIKKEVTIQQESKEELIKRVFKISEKLYAGLIRTIDTVNPLMQPRSLNKDGTIRLVSKEDWTSGFFPGALWYLYEYTQKDNWKKEAEKFTQALDSAQFVKWNHDVGFMIQNSFGQGYRLTGNKMYKQAVVDAAKSLITRYRPKAGIIQSWDTDAPWIQGRGLDMPVIIDNMMNLHLLYKGSKYTSDTTFAHIANMHALTTIKNQYRKDYSSYHLIDYDHKTGEVRKKVNFQGFSDASSWARGQAWGLYGYVEVYRETGNRIFLEQAKNIADFIMNNKKIPSDKIPYWDYDDSKIPNVPRDASAAAITASALLELQTFDKDNEKYLAYAEAIIRELSSDNYLAKKDENGGFILKHSVGNIHENNETDTAINYADFYFLEALLRWKNIND